MRIRSKASCIALVIVMGLLKVSGAWGDETTDEIEKSIRDYFTAMSSRDIEGVRRLIGKQFVAIESGGKNAIVHVVDSANTKELLPPEGNDDWNKNQIQLSSVRVEISTPNPSVAMAAFVMTHPMSDAKLSSLKEVLKTNPALLDEVRRKAMEQIIADRAMKFSMYAMLARQDDSWRIVCMSFPN